jgi:hypothetical protein
VNALAAKPPLDQIRGVRLQYEAAPASFRKRRFWAIFSNCRRRLIKNLSEKSKFLFVVCGGFATAHNKNLIFG